VATVVVYSHDPSIRERIRVAIGRTPAKDLAPLTYLDADNGPSLVATVDAGGIDLLVLDGEAWPEGGMGLSRQFKHEIDDCPAIVVIIGRPDDRWMAAWSQADAVVSHPIDPAALTDAVVGVLRERGERLPEPAPRRRLFHFGSTHR
jgi:DNA-binding response OmpR family regulator